jgi:hypothetical protein
MKLPSIQTNRQTTVALSTIFVVGLLFAYYFLVHTKTQENRLKRQAFNHLVTLSTGFKANLENHKIAIDKLLDGNVDLIISTYDATFQSLKRSSALNLDIVGKAEKGTLKILQDTIPQAEAFKLIRISRDNVDPKGSMDHWSRNVDVDISIKGDSILFRSTVRGEDRRNQFSLLFYTNLQRFIAQTFNSWIFEDFILISDDEIKFQTLDYKFESIDYDTLRKINREANYLRNIVERFKVSGSSADVVTDESLVGRAVSSSNFYDINISETEYKLFLNQFVVDGKFWVLCGLINADEFNQQKRAVEPSFLLITITVLLFILLASQLIKLFISSPVEQYYIHNIIFCVISITLGTSIIVISLMSMVSYWVEDRYVKDHELMVLNDDIRNAFLNELGEVIDYVKSGDEALPDSHWFNSPVIKPRKEFELEFQPQKTYDEAYENTFWINDKGDEIIRVYEKTKPLSLINVSKRAYFSELQAGRGYYFTDKKGESVKIYFQPVISWVTGKKIVVTSVKSKGAVSQNPNSFTPVVAAMATQFRSLQDCVLPNGFGFTLIDETGTVLFHHDRRLSLSENFLHEVSDVNEIKSAMESRTRSANSITYHNKKYRIFLQPVPNMPLYMVTYHDREYFRLPAVLIFYYTILFSHIGLLAVCFWVIFLYVFNYRGSKLKYKSLILNWAIPDSNKNDWYWKAALVNIIATIIVSLFVLFVSSSLTHRFLMIFLACNFIFPINYFLLKKSPVLDKERFNLRDIYQLVIKSHVTVAFIIILSCFNLIIILNGYDYWRSLFVYQFFLFMLLFFPFYMHRSAFLAALHNWLRKQSISHAYTSFTMSWLILVSVIPTIFYYDIAKTNERNIWGKYDQLQVIKRLHQRKIGGDSASKNEKGIYLNVGQYSDSGQAKISGAPAESMFINTIFYHLRLPTVELSEISKSMVSDMQTKSYDWDLWMENSKDDKRIIHFTYLNEESSLEVTSPEKLNGKSRVNSIYPGTTTRHYMKKVINTLLILLFLLLVYLLLYSLLKKIFGFEFLISKELLSTSKDQIHASLRNRNDVFVIGLPSPDFDDLKSSVKSLRRQTSEPGKADHEAERFKTLRIDLRQMQDINSKKVNLVGKDLVIIDHFEYSCKDLAKLRNNLSLIERIKKAHKQVIVFSHVSPRQIERIYRFSKPKTSQQNQEEAPDYTSDVDLWSKIMASFQVLHYQLKRYELREKYAPDSKKKLEVQLAELIKSELSASTYFKNVEHMVYEKYLEITKKHKEKPNVSQAFIDTVKEEMILYIQDIAQTYYYSLWNTCYKSQRFLLYDLAYDGIANFKDGATVLFLMKKGLLKFENKIEIMNQSFRHFVIDAIGEKDALAMRQEMRQKGAWSTTRIVLIIVAISLLIFILMVNKGSINQVSAIITGAVALVGAILRLFSFGSASSFVSNE